MTNDAVERFVFVCLNDSKSIGFRLYLLWLTNIIVIVQLPQISWKAEVRMKFRFTTGYSIIKYKSYYLEIIIEIKLQISRIRVCDLDEQAV